MPIELLELKKDYIFKRLFGYSSNGDITMSLLNSILNKKISILILLLKLLGLTKEEIEKL